MFKKDDLVTIRLKDNVNASNTYIVAGILKDEPVAILYHPLHPSCLIARNFAELNKIQANGKDATERLLEFALIRQDELDHNMRGDLEALRLFYVINKTLTNHQKSQLSAIAGNLASIYFCGDVNLAIKYVNDNSAVLDTYNSMWYSNFIDLFKGKKPIVSPKQRASIFNIAGFVLAQLESLHIRK